MISYLVFSSSLSPLVFVILLLPSFLFTFHFVCVSFSLRQTFGGKWSNKKKHRKPRDRREIKTENKWIFWIYASRDPWHIVFDGVSVPLFYPFVCTFVFVSIHSTPAHVFDSESVFLAAHHPPTSVNIKNNWIETTATAIAKQQQTRANSRRKNNTRKIYADTCFGEKRVNGTKRIQPTPARVRTEKWKKNGGDPKKRRTLFWHWPWAITQRVSTGSNACLLAWLIEYPIQCGKLSITFQM